MKPNEERDELAQTIREVRDWQAAHPEQNPANCEPTAPRERLGVIAIYYGVEHKFSQDEVTESEVGESK